MKPILILIALGCVIGAGLVAVSGSHDANDTTHVLHKRGKAELSPKTQKLVGSLLIILGVITEAVQLIMDGICRSLVDLYIGFLYPVLDCLQAIIGINDAVCAVSTGCVDDLYLEIASAAQAGIDSSVIGSGLTSASVSHGPGAAVRVDGSIFKKYNNAYDSDAAAIESFLSKFEGQDKLYAINSLKILALLNEELAFLEARLHVPVIVLCKPLRLGLGFDKPEISCPFSKEKAKNEGSESEKGEEKLIGSSIDGA